MVRQRVGLTLHIIGSLLKYFALAYLAPLIIALCLSERNWYTYLIALLVTLGIGLTLEFRFKTDKEIDRADGFAIVAFTWLAIALLGTLPYIFPPVKLGFLDAFFEAMSGFTTTGATILEEVEALPKSALLWRSFTQWIGGMGVILLFIAILPKLAVGGSQLFDREFPGPLPEKLRPRFRTTARHLWSIYLLFTVAEIALLFTVAKLPLFDSICISFSTISTGGFAPTTGSIATYANPVAEYIIMLFMLLAGTSFIIHYHVFHGNWKALKDEEFKLYLITLAFASCLLIVAQDFASYRQGIFQAISIMTTTGFATANFACWHASAKIVLLALMFIGACGGSTAGAIKVARVLILVKHSKVMMRRAIFPKAVIRVKYDKKPVPDEIIRDITSFLFFYILIALGASIVLCFFGFNLETAISAVAATLGNVGPGLSDVGPALNYAWLPGPAKLILIFCMWLGRLELFTVLMIFSPRFWKG